jgi:hypothetical protein
MKVIDPGHTYQLDGLDGGEPQTIRFVKRCEPPEKYPGNVGSYPGTTIQEVLRVLIDRAQYVGRQVPCEETDLAIEAMRDAIRRLEERAARRHGRTLSTAPDRPELEPTCPTCGHIRCEEHS